MLKWFINCKAGLRPELLSAVAAEKQDKSFICKVTRHQHRGFVTQFEKPQNNVHIQEIFFHKTKYSFIKHNPLSLVNNVFMRFTDHDPSYCHLSYVFSKIGIEHSMNELFLGFLQLEKKSLNVALREFKCLNGS